MKTLRVKLGDQSVKTIWTPGEHLVDLDVCIPNDWNMNVMSESMYEKTKLGIIETVAESKKLPPITVRPHPTKRRKLQIIDGFHRWKMYKEEKYPQIEVFVIYVGTQQAKLMTAQLNYNRGDPDMEKYPQYLASMARDYELDAKYLSERLPDSEDEIKSYFASIDFEVEQIVIPKDDDGDLPDGAMKDASNTDALLELKFSVRQGAGEVIEKELVRLGAHLGGGKNVRGRALEMMAVLSSQTPDDSIDPGIDLDDNDAPRKKKKKKLNVRI